MNILAKYEQQKDQLDAIRALVESEVANLDAKSKVLYDVGRAVGMIDSLNSLMENIKGNDGAGVDLQEYCTELIAEATVAVK